MPTELLIIVVFSIYCLVTVGYELWLTFEVWRHPALLDREIESEFWQRIYLGLRSLIWPILLIQFLYRRLLPVR